MEAEGCVVRGLVGWGRLRRRRMETEGCVFEDGLDGALAPKAASWWDYWFGEGVPGAVGVGKPKAGGRIGLARGFPGSKGIDLFSHEV